eukprot:8655280-Pyramimonas_sp.AAC.1
MALAWRSGRSVRRVVMACGVGCSSESLSILREGSGARSYGGVAFLAFRRTGNRSSTMPLRIA